MCSSLELLTDIDETQAFGDIDDSKCLLFILNSDFWQEGFDSIKPCKTRFTLIAEEYSYYTDCRHGLTIARTLLQVPNAEFPK